MTENEIATIIVDLCIKIHKTLGPGLLESVYESALCYELSRSNITFERQKEISVIYENVVLDVGFRADVIVEDKVIVELKSIENLLNVQHKNLITYLKV